MCVGRLLHLTIPPTKSNEKHTWKAHWLYKDLVFPLFLFNIFIYCGWFERCMKQSVYQLGCSTWLMRGQWIARSRFSVYLKCVKVTGQSQLFLTNMWCQTQLSKGILKLPLLSPPIQLEFSKTLPISPISMLWPPSLLKKEQTYGGCKANSNILFKVVLLIMWEHSTMRHFQL